jgi:hypothetical protein
VTFNLVTSLRQNLGKIGEPKPDKIIKIPSTFHSFPKNKSLKMAIHAMNSPLIEGWTMINEKQFENTKWTEECQGVAGDGISWFLVSTNNEVKALYKFSLNFDLLGSVPPGGFVGGNWPPEALPNNLHIGPPNFYDNKIYVPVEPSACVWILDTNLNTLSVKPLGGKIGSTKQGASMPWCAINPWNGLLYSSKFGEPPYWEDDPSGSGVGRLVDPDPVTEVHCYDPQKNFAYVKSLTLEGEPLHKVQGGCFSDNGRLYLTSDYTQHIRAYNALNGAFLGYKWVDYDKSGLTYTQEIEGICIVPVRYREGYTHVHIVVLENEKTSSDDFFFKHYSVPNPDVL